MNKILREIKTQRFAGLTVAFIGLSILILFSTPVHGKLLPYGSIGQEDELFTTDKNGLYYVNTGVKYGIGNGSFEQVNEINEHFTINGAIKTFGIYEDTEAFIYEPILSNGKHSDILFVYKINGEHFELISIHEDKSGIDQMVTQLENSD